MGSDGRDDIIMGIDSENNNIVNYDENLFLTYIESAEGDLDKTYQNLTQSGSLMDDLSLMKIHFVGKTSEKEKLESNLKQFEEFKNTNQLDKCIQLGNSIINEYPHLTNFLYELSLIYQANKNFEKAIDLGERIRLRESNNITNLITLIESYKGTGNIERAELILEACLKARPNEERLRMIKLNLMSPN